jgi:outer membrane protein OmpU
MGSFTFSASKSETDSVTASTDIEVSSYQIAYTLTDDISITYGTETFDKDGSAKNEEVIGLGASYTSGGMTISGSAINAEGGGHTAGAESNKWSLTAAFAF